MDVTPHVGSEGRTQDHIWHLEGAQWASLSQIRGKMFPSPQHNPANFPWCCLLASLGRVCLPRAAPTLLPASQPPSLIVLQTWVLPEKGLMVADLCEADCATLWVPLHRSRPVPRGARGSVGNGAETVPHHEDSDSSVGKQCVGLGHSTKHCV